MFSPTHSIRLSHTRSLVHSKSLFRSLTLTVRQSHIALFTPTRTRSVSLTQPHMHSISVDLHLTHSRSSHANCMVLSTSLHAHPLVGGVVSFSRSHAWIRSRTPSLWPPPSHAHTHTDVRSTRRLCSVGLMHSLSFFPPPFHAHPRPLDLSLQTLLKFSHSRTINLVLKLTQT